MFCLYCETGILDSEHAPFCSTECEASYAAEEAELDAADSLEPDDDDFNCIVCFDGQGTAADEVCDDCGDRHCPACEVCA